MDVKTYLAVGEMMQAAGHHLGIVGPVMFTVSNHQEPQWCANCGDCWMCRDESPVADEFFYAQQMF